MSGPRILVGSDDGLLSFDDGGAAGSAELEDRAVTFLAPAGRDVWAIVDGAELWRASGEDAGPWQRVAELAGHRMSCLAATDDDVVVGASEARLFRLEGERLEPVGSFDQVEGRDTWHTPWGGPPDVRSISEWDAAVYVNVHVGGIPRTDDGGGTWTPTIDIDADVHQVTTAEGLVLAACAWGLASSTDRGASWTFRTDGLEARYSRAAAVCGDVLLVSASQGPRGGRSAVYRGDLAEGEFERCREGLPEWFDDNVDSHCLDALPDGSFAAFGSSDGHLYASTDAGTSWDEVASGLPSIHRVLVMPSSAAPGGMLGAWTKGIGDSAT